MLGVLSPKRQVHCLKTPVCFVFVFFKIKSAFGFWVEGDAGLFSKLALLVCFYGTVLKWSQCRSRKKLEKHLRDLPVCIEMSTFNDGTVPSPFTSQTYPMLEVGREAPRDLSTAVTAQSRQDTDS